MFPAVFIIDSVMSILDLTLVTYTYNDELLLNDLVACIETWSQKPREIVVLDDGSTIPYAPPEIKTPLRLIRNEVNQGITRAKHKAISAGTSKFILAMDCDARINSSWIQYCLPHAMRPDVGMVSGPSIYLSGADAVSKYQLAFGDNHNLNKEGMVDFIPGNAFLLRREVWNECGGMSGHEREVCQDHYLSKQIKSLGLGLWIDSRARIKQVRRISRIAMLKRHWKWCHLSVKSEATRASCIEDYIYAGLVAPHARRLRHAVEQNEPLLVYLDILYLSFTILDVLDYLSIDNSEYETSKKAVWEQLELIGAKYPVFRAILRADLAQLGKTPVSGLEFSADKSWQRIFKPTIMMEKSGIIKWLDQVGIPMMLEEEKTMAYDYSFYEFTNH